MQKAAVLGVWVPPGAPPGSHACAGLLAMLLAGVCGRSTLLLRALLRPGVRAPEGASRKLPHAALLPCAACAGHVPCPRVCVWPMTGVRLRAVGSSLGGAGRAPPRGAGRPPDGLLRGARRW